MEADERGLLSELLDFTDEGSPVSRALTYCDLTTDPAGQPVEPSARIAEVRERYGPESPEGRAMRRSETQLLEDVRLVEAMLAEHGGRQDMSLIDRGPNR